MARRGRAAVALLLIAGAAAAQAPAPCQSDASCAKGWQCDAVPGEAPRCRPRCGSGCQAGERCTTLAPFGVARAPVCVAERDRLCRPCAADRDCGLPRDACVDQVSGERTCGRDCAWDGACPPGFRCADPGGVDGEARPRQCIPTAGCCNCEHPEVADRNEGVGEGAAPVAVEPPWAPPPARPAPTTPARRPGDRGTEYDSARAGPGGFPVVKARTALPRPDWWNAPDVSWGWSTGSGGATPSRAPSSSSSTPRPSSPTPATPAPASSDRVH
jgi:hypothetical protein